MRGGRYAIMLACVEETVDVKTNVLCSSKQAMQSLSFCRSVGKIA
jgi:hypothetical protein